ncbi:MAG: hypothetical protein ACKOXQ_08070 [Hydrogenophaga sp.]
MDKSMMKGLAVGGLAMVVLGSGAVTGYRTLAQPQQADVVAGAVAGGHAGNQVQKSLPKNDVVTRTEQRCKTVQVKSEQLAGYDVRYRLNGQEATARTSFKPGATLPVKDGQVVLTPPGDARS